MNQSSPASYLRSHRKRSGLSQNELAQLLGCPDTGSISRHERLRCVPSLPIALRYQALFHVTVADLFPGAYEAAREAVEAGLAQMEHDLQQCSAKGRNAAMIARKLEWMWERRQAEQPDSRHATGLT